MGREIRRVPKGWQHPKTVNRYSSKEEYQPMYDEDFETAAREWLDNAIAWDNGTHKDAEKHKADHPYFWQWENNPPDAEYYRPKWTEEPTCYQIYETVSEGTPDSPVFETLDEMREWLVEEGYSEDAARKFCEHGYVPSLIVFNGAISVGIDAASRLYD